MKLFETVPLLARLAKGGRLVARVIGYFSPSHACFGKLENPIQLPRAVSYEAD